jgi:AraC family transcriptional regulator of adaptative response / DNA-3-methyladenine glycosylase II
MQLDAEQCYRALRAHDARFDGRFFVGVSTTGIYCRPVCPARTPRPSSCRYFPSAAAAEAGGFRPCLRCRPELAPGFAVVDANRRLAEAAARAIEDGRLDEEGLPRLAGRLGVTDRHLRRVFQQEFGVAPIEYAQTQRLLLAKRLLSDTDLPVLDVALASGFASLRRFNHLFRTRYRMTPGDLRRQAPRRPAGQLAFDLAFRPPYDWDGLLAFLGKRAIAGVETVEGARYARTLRLPSGAAGWITVNPSRRKSSLRVTVSSSLASHIPAVLARVKHLLDLACRPAEVSAALGDLAAANPGLRLPGAMDGFEVAVRAILGQQVTVGAASAQARRFAAAFGPAAETPCAALERHFPSAIEVAALEPDAIAALGIIGARARAIVALAKEIAAGRLVLEVGADAGATITALQSVPGIGPWTAEYIAMRALGWPDAFPPGDVAVLKALGTKDRREALERAEAWRPWRAYAVLHLWKSLEKTP